jgi:succinyl-diaminopimelate desuccinylase
MPQLDAFETLLDPVALTQALVRVPSYTPDGGDGIAALEAMLKPLGFACQRLDFDDTANLYASLSGGQGPNLCFAGHTDVVPLGEASAWTLPPFAAEIRAGLLYGRGTADMKGAIAAFVSACAAHIQAHGAPRGTISFLITGDEEGPAINGTKRALDALMEQGVRFDGCIVGEPTSEAELGDIIKNGRRGSLNVHLSTRGVQGHVAYPHKASNPVAALLDCVRALTSRTLDDGAEGFDPSNLEVTGLETTSQTFNVIPAGAAARLNIRFNTHHTRASLIAWIEAEAKASKARTGFDIGLAFSGSGEAFYSPPGRLTQSLREAIAKETGVQARLTTGGGTSDARFIHAVCPVAELGLKNDTAHQIDEHVAIADIETLSRVYTRVLGAWFA